MLQQGQDVMLCMEGRRRRATCPSPTRWPTTCTTATASSSTTASWSCVTLEVHAPRVVARVVHGGQLSSHKGMNLPGVQVSAPSITEKDRADVAFAVEQQLDYLALSFVRRADDIAELRAILPKDILICAKIEKDNALENIEEILRGHRRGDGGARRPGRGAALRAGAASRRSASSHLANARRPAGDHGHADARVHDRRTRGPRAPRRATSPTRSSTAPTR